MRTPPNGRTDTGKPGTHTTAKRRKRAANDDKATREIIARRARADGAYSEIPCTDDALPLCAEDRRIARIEAPALTPESGRDDWGVDGTPRD